MIYYYYNYRQEGWEPVNPDEDSIKMSLYTIITVTSYRSSLKSKH